MSSLQLLIINIVLILSTTGCIGLQTEKPLCKKESLVELKEFEGPYSFSLKGVEKSGWVEKIEPGIYFLREQNVLRSRPENLHFFALRFCRIGKTLTSEYQFYDRSSKTLSPKTFLASTIEQSQKLVKLFVNQISIHDLDTHSIPYLQYTNREGITSYGFTIANTNRNIDLKVVNAVKKAEEIPSTVIDLKNRKVFSHFDF